MNYYTKKFKKSKKIKGGKLKFSGKMYNFLKMKTQEGLNRLKRAYNGEREQKWSDYYTGEQRNLKFVKYYDMLTTYLEEKKYTIEDLNTLGTKLYVVFYASSYNNNNGTQKRNPNNNGTQKRNPNNNWKGLDTKKIDKLTPKMVKNFNESHNNIHGETNEYRIAANERCKQIIIDLTGETIENVPIRILMRIYDVLVEITHPRSWRPEGMGQDQYSGIDNE